MLDQNKKNVYINIRTTSFRWNRQKDVKVKLHNFIAVYGYFCLMATHRGVWCFINEPLCYISGLLYQTALKSQLTAMKVTISVWPKCVHWSVSVSCWSAHEVHLMLLAGNSVAFKQTTSTYHPHYIRTMQRMFCQSTVQKVTSEKMTHIKEHKYAYIRSTNQPLVFCTSSKMSPVQQKWIMTNNFD